MKNDLPLKRIPLNESFILFADDDGDDRIIMSEFFTSKGYPFKMFSSGQSVINFLQLLPSSDYPAFVFLDYNMPRINGEHVLTFIKSSEILRHIPVIIYSSEMNDRLRSRLLSQGAFACLSKVFQVSQLDKMKVIIESLVFVPS